jgi:hypothetical protein
MTRDIRHQFADRYERYYGNMKRGQLVPRFGLICYLHAPKYVYTPLDLRLLGSCMMYDNYSW